MRKREVARDLQYGSSMTLPSPKEPNRATGRGEQSVWVLSPNHESVRTLCGRVGRLCLFDISHVLHHAARRFISLRSYCTRAGREQLHHRVLFERDGSVESAEGAEAKLGHTMPMI